MNKHNQHEVSKPYWDYWKVKSCDYYIKYLFKKNRQIQFTYLATFGKMLLQVFRFEFVIPVVGANVQEFNHALRVFAGPHIGGQHCAQRTANTYSARTALERRRTKTRKHTTQVFSRIFHRFSTDCSKIVHPVSVSGHNRTTISVREKYKIMIIGT